MAKFIRGLPIDKEDADALLEYFVHAFESLWQNEPRGNVQIGAACTYRDGSDPTLELNLHGVDLMLSISILKEPD